MKLKHLIFAVLLIFISSSPQTVSAKQKHMAYNQEIATATIAMEASGEGPDGMVAVAFVLLNRVRDGRWGDSLAAVCWAPEQFSGWNTFDNNRKRIAAMKNADPILQAAAAALTKALTGYPDPTLGATHYYSVTMPAPPAWAATGRFLIQIGKHRFYDKVK